MQIGKKSALVAALASRSLSFPCSVVRLNGARLPKNKKKSAEPSKWSLHVTGEPFYILFAQIKADMAEVRS